MGIERSQRVIASLFDRLTDESPSVQSEANKPIQDQIGEYEKSVARDLANLLNTRRSEGDIPVAFESCRDSILAYGMQDLATLSVEQEEIRQSIERTIKQFEPRLGRAKVAFDEYGDHDLSFIITGVLWIGMGWEPVVFGADVPTETRRFQVLVQQ